MTMFVILVIVFAGLVAVAVFAVMNERRGEVSSALNPEQVKEKEANLARSLAFARERGEVTNDDIERLLGVSNATAERYLHELETQGHLVQIGKTGKGVRYKLK